MAELYKPPADQGSSSTSPNFQQPAQDNQPPTRKSKGRVMRELTAEEKSKGLTVHSTKAQLKAARKRLDRENKAIEKGKPLKDRRATYKQTWDPSVKAQVVAYWNRHFLTLPELSRSVHDIRSFDVSYHNL